VSCEDGSSLSFQKSLVICYSGYGPKCVISLTSAVSQMADAFVRYAEKKIGEFLFLSAGRMLQSFLPFKCTDFMKCVREL